MSKESRNDESFWSPRSVSRRARNKRVMKFGNGIFAASGLAGCLVGSVAATSDAFEHVSTVILKGAELDFERLGHAGMEYSIALVLGLVALAISQKK